MEEFRIYCTEEQTRKALELGAPIVHYENAYTSESIPHFYVGEYGNYQKGFILYIIPTAEEMIGWIEEKGLYFLTGMDDEDNFFFNVYHNEGYIEVRGCDSRKEATLAAISKALEYLENKKEE